MTTDILISSVVVIIVVAAFVEFVMNHQEYDDDE